MTEGCDACKNRRIEESMYPVSAKRIEILLVDDNSDDVTLTFEAFKESGIPSSISAVRNGEEALDYLHRRGAFDRASRPNLILLDLNLPGKSGSEVLKDIKSDESLKAIPVVILTTSRDDADIAESYRLHANCFITKPVDLERFLDVVKTIESFWFSIASLPSAPPI